MDMGELEQNRWVAWVSRFDKLQGTLGPASGDGKDKRGDGADEAGDASSFNTKALLGSKFKKLVVQEEQSYPAWVARSNVKLGKLVSIPAEMKTHLRHLKLPKSYENFTSSTGAYTAGLYGGSLVTTSLPNQRGPTDDDAVRTYFKGLYRFEDSISSFADANFRLSRAASHDMPRVHKWLAQERAHLEDCTAVIADREERARSLHRAQQPGGVLSVSLMAVSSVCSHEQRLVTAAKAAEAEALRVYEAAQEATSASTRRLHAVRHFASELDFQKDLLLKVNSVRLDLAQRDRVVSQGRLDMYKGVSEVMVGVREKVLPRQVVTEMEFVMNRVLAEYEQFLQLTMELPLKPVEAPVVELVSGDSGETAEHGANVATAAAATEVKAMRKKEMEVFCSIRTGLELVRLWKQTAGMGDGQAPVVVDMSAKIDEFQLTLLAHMRDPRWKLASTVERDTTKADIKVLVDTTAVLYTDRYVHATPPGHVESSLRVQTSLRLLRQQEQDSMYNDAESSKYDRGVTLVKDESIIGPPLWVLPLVHSPGYLRHLYALEEEAFVEDLYVPVEFDTEWESDDPAEESDFDGDVFNPTQVTLAREAELKRTCHERLVVRTDEAKDALSNVDLEPMLDLLQPLKGDARLALVFREATEDDVARNRLNPRKVTLESVLCAGMDVDTPFGAGFCLGPKRADTGIVPVQLLKAVPGAKGYFHVSLLAFPLDASLREGEKRRIGRPPGKKALYIQRRDAVDATVKRPRGRPPGWTKDSGVGYAHVGQGYAVAKKKELFDAVDMKLHEVVMGLVQRCGLQRVIADAIGLNQATFSLWVTGKVTGNGAEFTENLINTWLKGYDRDVLEKCAAQEALTAEEEKKLYMLFKPVGKPAVGSGLADSNYGAGIHTHRRKYFASVKPPAIPCVADALCGVRPDGLGSDAVVGAHAVENVLPNALRDLVKSYMIHNQLSQSMVGKLVVGINGLVITQNTVSAWFRWNLKEPHMTHTTKVFADLLADPTSMEIYSESDQDLIRRIKKWADEIEMPEYMPFRRGRVSNKEKLAIARKAAKAAGLDVDSDVSSDEGSDDGDRQRGRRAAPPAATAASTAASPSSSSVAPMHALFGRPSAAADGDGSCGSGSREGSGSGSDTDSSAGIEELDSSEEKSTANAESKAEGAVEEEESDASKPSAAADDSDGDSNDGGDDDRDLPPLKKSRTSANVGQGQGRTVATMDVEDFDESLIEERPELSGRRSTADGGYGGGSSSENEDEYKGEEEGDDDDEFIPSGSGSAKPLTHPIGTRWDTSKPKTRPPRVSRQRYDGDTDKGERFDPHRICDLTQYEKFKEHINVREYAGAGIGFAKTRHYNQCEVCKGAGRVIICSKCPCVYHFTCIKDQLNPDTPPTDWMCVKCSALQIDKCKKVVFNRPKSARRTPWLLFYQHESREWQRAEEMDRIHQENLVLVRWKEMQEERVQFSWLRCADGAEVYRIFAENEPPVTKLDRKMVSRAHEHLRVNNLKPYEGDEYQDGSRKKFNRPIPPAIADKPDKAQKRKGVGRGRWGKNAKKTDSDAAFSGVKVKKEGGAVDSAGATIPKKRMGRPPKDRSGELRESGGSSAGRPATTEKPTTGMSDTYIGSQSLRAALATAGTACLAVDTVMVGSRTNAFVCSRPPGHHAGRFGCTKGCLSTGFCLLNNAAIASVYARVRWGLDRVAVVDIDVHFGNGTAELLRGDDRAFFASVHMVYGKNNMGVGIASSTEQSESQQQQQQKQQEDGGQDVGFYPAQLGGTEVSSNYVSVGVLPEPSRKGLGPVDTDMGVHTESEEKRGTRDPIYTLAGKAGYRQALVDYIIPALRTFDPQLLIISAGFDGYTSDPLGGELQLSLEDFQWSTARLCEAVGQSGKVVSLLEGGYDTDPHTTGLAKCVDAHVRALRGIKVPTPEPASPSGSGSGSGSESGSESDSPVSMRAEE